MYRMNSALKTRLHGFALTHDGGRLFIGLMSGLVLAWLFVALIVTGGLCKRPLTFLAHENQVPSVLVTCQPSDEVMPGRLLRCVIEPTPIRTHDI